MSWYKKSFREVATNKLSVAGAEISAGSFGAGMFGTKVFYVDGTNGSDGHDGTSSDHAVETIQRGIDLASAGAIIYIKPQTYKLGTGFNRYSEDVAITLGGAGGSGVVATNANMSLVGLTQVGCPVDFLGVRWIFATDTCLLVDAPCIHLENIGFFSEAATYAVHLRNNGATRTQEGTTGFSMYNCAVKGDGKIYGNGCNEIQIVHCRFQAKYDGTVGGINLVGSSNQVVRPVIRDCEFIGGNANNMSDSCIVGAAPWYDALIRDCYFLAESDTGTYINISGSNTGMVANCYFGSADITTTSIVASGMLGVACYDDDGVQAAPIA